MSTRTTKRLNRIGAWRYTQCVSFLTHDASVSKRIAPRLWPDCKAVWFVSDWDRFHGPGRCINCVDNLVKAARAPQKFTVCTDISHIRAAAAGNRPCRLDFARGEINH